MPVADPRREGLRAPTAGVLAMAAVFAFPPGATLYLVGFFFAYFMNDQVDVVDHGIFLAAGLLALAVSATGFSALIVRHLRPVVARPVLAAFAATATFHAAFLAVFAFFMAREESGSDVVGALVAGVPATVAAFFGTAALRWLRRG